MLSSAPSHGAGRYHALRSINMSLFRSEARPTLIVLDHEELEWQRQWTKKPMKDRVLRPKTSGAVRRGGTQLDKYQSSSFRPSEPRPELAGHWTINIHSTGVKNRCDPWETITRTHQNSCTLSPASRAGCNGRQTKRYVIFIANQWL